MKRCVMKLLALCLCAAMMAGVLCACGEGQTPTEPKPTQPPEEARVTKVLTIGDGNALNPAHILALVAKTEGVTDLVIGTLWLDESTLQQQVQSIQSDSNEYRLNISFVKDGEIGYNIVSQSAMEQALQYDYWDIVMLQGNIFEVAGSDAFTNGNIQAIQSYVLEHAREVPPVFAWNMTHVPPTDSTLRSTYKGTPNIYDEKYAAFGNNRQTLLDAVAKNVQDHILTDSTFQLIMPTGIAVENAVSSYLQENRMYYNYAYVSNLGRVVEAYVWYCKLFGIERLEEVKLDYLPKEFLYVSVNPGGYRLSEQERAVILEAVNNALANPLQITPSQYTTAG